MKFRDGIHASPPYLLAFGAATCFVLAIYSALTDRLRAGTLLSTLFLLCTVLAYFPQLESLKAFSVDIKLRRSLDRADEMLQHIRDIAAATARAIYATTAWANRWDGMSPKDKQEMLDAVGKQLEALNVPAREISEIAGPYVRLIGFDLYGIFQGSARGALHHAVGRASDGPANAVAEWDAKWRHDGPASIEEYLSSGTTLARHMKLQISSPPFSEADSRALARMADRIGNIFDGCRDRAGYTSEALVFIAPYREGFSNQPAAYYSLLAL